MCVARWHRRLPLSKRSLNRGPGPAHPPCLQGFNQGTPPIACPLARNASVVHRWFSGDEQGTLTASSCGNTTGDPVIQLLSSPNPAGGPWRCEGSQDDDGERRGLAAQQAGGRWPYAGQGAAPPPHPRAPCRHVPQQQRDRGRVPTRRHPLPAAEVLLFCHRSALHRRLACAAPDRHQADGRAAGTTAAGTAAQKGRVSAHAALPCFSSAPCSNLLDLKL